MVHFQAQLLHYDSGWFLHKIKLSGLFYLHDMKPSGCQQHVQLQPPAAKHSDGVDGK